MQIVFILILFSNWCFFFTLLFRWFSNLDIFRRSKNTNQKLKKDTNSHAFCPPARYFRGDSANQFALNRSRPLVVFLGDKMTKFIGRVMRSRNLRRETQIFAWQAQTDRTKKKKLNRLCTADNDLDFPLRGSRKRPAETERLSFERKMNKSIHVYVRRMCGIDRIALICIYWVRSTNQTRNEKRTNVRTKRGRESLRQRRNK